MTSFLLTALRKPTPTQLELTLKIADRSRVFNGIVGENTVHITGWPLVAVVKMVGCVLRTAIWQYGNMSPRGVRLQRSELPLNCFAVIAMQSTKLLRLLGMSHCRGVDGLFAGQVISQSQILIRLIVPGVAVLNESFHTLEEGGTDIPWTALWVGEAKIGADKQALV